MKECCICGRRHIGSLVFATPGFMLLFRNEWEDGLSEQDFDYWTRAFTRTVKLPTSSLKDFLGMSMG